MHLPPTNIRDVPTIESWWKNNQKTNGDLYDLFATEVHNTPYLLEHRRHMEQNKLGFGDLPFHYMWKVLLDDIAYSFDAIQFMEIGVFKGQVLSLVPLISKHSQMACTYLGVTPLSNAGDKFSKYPDDDYESIVTGVFDKFGVEFNIHENIIRGFSTDPAVVDQIKQRSFNLVYVDGSHDYADVISDIKIVDEILEVGGYVVFDDASKFMDMPKRIWPGHADVSRAVKDIVESDGSYKEVFACGHNRVFRKIN